MQVKQRLWAQCRSCFSLQGSAVRAGLHIPVYHLGLCTHHFAPAIAYLLLQQKEVDKFLDKLAEPTLDAVDVLRAYLTVLDRTPEFCEKQVARQLKKYT